jgi:UDP-2-acetamido-2-deoxy-ribo-hexuluronate aminotransferase
MKIKFNDIYKQDKKIVPEILKNLKNIIIKSDFILGNDVRLFEKKLSKFVGTKYCVSCANGSDALYLVIKSLDLKKADEVIVPAMTYVATASAVINNNVRLRLADVNLRDGSINQNDVIKKINKRTKAIIFVNLWGHCSVYDKLKKICKQKKIVLIEDAAQSIGATNLKNIKSGKIGDISCFSFFPGKNLGAYGDGGAILTGNKKTYEKILKLRVNGAKNKFQYDYIGINSRLDNIQASILNLKLKNIDNLNNKKRLIAKYYYLYLKNKKIQLFDIGLKSCFHQFVILVKKRSEFLKYLDKNKIPFGLHYPYSINKLKAFKYHSSDKNLDVADRIGKDCVSLPIDPNLKKIQIKYIVDKINNY